METNVDGLSVMALPSEASSSSRSLSVASVERVGVVPPGQTWVEVRMQTLTVPPSGSVVL